MKKQPGFIALAILIGSSSLNAGDSQRTKEFIVMGYEGILSDLRSGEGPYLRTLKELLGNPEPKAIEQIRALSKKYPNIMDFAEHILKLEAPARGKGTPVETAMPIPAGPHIYSEERLENALTHLTRGMKVTIFTKGGGQFSGQFEEFAIRRLWIRGASRKSFLLDDIVAIEAPQL